jgi:predicted SnoaL-like aldol condensation-catalyzing enzyme
VRCATWWASFRNGFRPEPARLLSEDDLVVTHGLYHGFGPEPMAGFDVWRVANGMIVEHWDALRAWVSANPSGHSMTDGPTEVTEPAKTAKFRVENDRLVEHWDVVFPKPERLPHDNGLF